MSKKIERRDFLALMGLGGAAATIGCGKQTEETWRPWVEPVEGDLPYVPRHYATTTREAGGQGLWVKTINGRAQRILGNPEHPINAGGVSAKAQSSVQALYGAGRVKAPRVEGMRGLTVEKAMNHFMEKIEEHKGGSVHALTGSVSGSVADVWARFVAAAGSGRHTRFESFSPAALAKASEIVFGNKAVPHISLAGCDYVVSLGAKFLESWGDHTQFGREYGDARTPDHGKRIKHVQFEARMSGTGAMADLWLTAKPGSETKLAMGLLKEVASHSDKLSAADKSTISALVGDADLQAAATEAGLDPAKLVHLAEELHKAKSAVVLPAEDMALGSDVVAHHVAVLLINKALGGIGPHFNYSRAIPGERVVDHTEIKALIDDLNAGSVDLLIIKDANPAYALPNSGFAEAVKKAKYVVAFADTDNETTALAHMVLPTAHDLEAWGEVNTYTGLDMLQQPVMRPRFKLVQAEDALIRAIKAMDENALSVDNFRDHLKAQWIEKFGSGEADPEKFWRDSLRIGGRFQLAESGDDLALAQVPGNVFADVSGAAPSPALVVQVDSRFGDGLAANRGWMQELPDQMTGVTWGSWVEMSRAKAESMGLTYGDVVKVEAAGGVFEAPAYPSDVMTDDIISIATGQGHTNYGETYNRGANAFQFLGKDLDPAGLFAIGPMRANITRTGAVEKLATPHLPGKGDRMYHPRKFTSEYDSHYERAFFQSIAIGSLGGHGDGHGGGHGDGHGGGHGPKYDLDSRFPMHTKTDFYPDRGKDPVVVGEEATFYDPYKWEMSIDLNRCSGCGSCVTACYAENNLAVVGKDQVVKGREMAWMRLNRYIMFNHEHGDGSEVTGVGIVPMLCQQCGSAPCETVCPTLATYHTKEGLNAMVYNRCVGTRYCSNNCSYKVRRFNWFDYKYEGDLNWQLNPTVSQRGRGVMEKCTFCVQMVRDAKETARNEGRTVKDGEARTACQEACSSRAITFGNIMDKDSAVYKHAHDQRAYRALDDHLHTRPAISYLKRVVLDEAHS